MYVLDECQRALISFINCLYWLLLYMVNKGIEGVCTNCLETKTLDFRYINIYITAVGIS